MLKLYTLDMCGDGLTSTEHILSVIYYILQLPASIDRMKTFCHLPVSRDLTNLSSYKWILM